MIYQFKISEKRMAKSVKNNASVQAVIQNLKDAGCDAKTVERFMELEEEGKIREQLDLLASHRRQLLDRVHKEENRIECLHYLVYQIQKKKPAV